MGESVTGSLHITTVATGHHGSTAPQGQTHVIRIDLSHAGTDESSRACIDELIRKFEAAARDCKITLKVTRTAEDAIPPGKNWK